MLIEEADRAMELSRLEKCKDTDEHNTAQSVLEIRSTVSFLNSPTLATLRWAPRTTTTWQSDPSRSGTTMSNVQFRNCEQENLTLDCCAWENVTMINCKFINTIFREVTLMNVTLENVVFDDSSFRELHLENVTLSKLCFKKDVWRNTLVQRALLGEQSFVEQSFDFSPLTIGGYGIKKPPTFSMTTLGSIGSLPPSQLSWKKYKYSKEPVGRDIHYVQYVRPESHGIHRLAPHKPIWDRIMEFCFHISDVHIYEYPKGLFIPGEQEEYSVTDNNNIHDGVTQTTHDTTYFGSLDSDTPIGANLPASLPSRGLNSCLNLLRVDKELGQLAKESLYGRTFHFQCSALGANNFMVQHRTETLLMKQIVLYYHWPDEPEVISTDDESWKNLLATIRHSFATIPRMHVHVGRLFWDVRSPEYPFARPFQDLDKVAAPDQRWTSISSIKDGDPPREDGTKLAISIGGTTNASQATFVRSITRCIEICRKNRPLFVKDARGWSTRYKCKADFDYYNWDD